MTRESDNQERGLSRRELLQYGLYGGLGCSLATGFLAAGCSEPARSNVKNVIVIVIDTLRRDTLGCFGNALGLSPHIDAVAKEGARFEQAISCSGWTLPAMGSLLTGTWPSIHGGLGRRTNLSPIRPEVATAAEAFKQGGFDNTFGLANCAFMSPILGLDRGFDEYDVEHAFNSRIRRAKASLDTSLDFLLKHDRESNFVFIHLFDPHLDYDPLPAFRDRFIQGRANPPLPLDMKKCMALMTFNGEKPPVPKDIDYVRGAYHAEVCAVDAQIGRFVDTLKRMGLYDEAALVITADHGEEFWEHGGFEHGHTLYDELIRVPLIIKPPAVNPPAVRCVQDPVRHIDVMPTLFDWMGVRKPDTFIGRSFAPLISGKKLKTLDAFSESTLYGDQFLSWRSDSYKYIFNMAEKTEKKQQLFDWKNDPEEMHDLSGEKPALARELYEQLSQFCEAVRAKVDKMTPSEFKDMSPKEVESLKSLGYIR